MTEIEAQDPESGHGPVFIKSAQDIQNESLAETLKSLLAPMQAQLTQLVEENKTAKAENQQLREELNTLAANPVPAHLQGDDFPVNPNAARSVVIATRPVMDNPEKYSRNKSVVDPGGLVRNDASPLSGKNRE